MAKKNGTFIRGPQTLAMAMLTPVLEPAQEHIQAHSDRPIRENFRGADVRFVLVVDAEHDDFFLPRTVPPQGQRWPCLAASTPPWPWDIRIDPPIDHRYRQ